MAHSNEQSSRDLLFQNSIEMNGAKFSFLADFVSEDMIPEFFGYQQQRVSETASDSCSYGGGVAEMGSENHSSGFYLGSGKRHIGDFRMNSIPTLRISLGLLQELSESYEPTNLYSLGTC